VLEHPGVPGWVTAVDGGFHRVTGGGGPAARAHDGDPQGGRVAQVVRGSSVRPAISPFRLGGEMSRGEPVRLGPADLADLRHIGRPESPVPAADTAQALKASSDRPRGYHC
jgi:hypothetical protein